MCIDDDGDVAHEFYEEVTSSPGKPWMRRITENLIEQVSYSFYIPSIEWRGELQGQVSEFTTPEFELTQSSLISVTRGKLHVLLGY